MLARLFLWSLVAAVAAGAACGLRLLYLRSFEPSVTAVQLQRRVEAIGSGRSWRPRHAFVPLSQVSPHLRHAVVAAEDGRFFEHRGIDWVELRHSIADNARRGRLWRGGSTITQQLVKNLFLTTHRSVVRKALEVPLALLAELILPKRRILELYLNVIEWGPGIFGAEAASRYHYGVSAAVLSREQAARLAACVPAPRVRTPQRVDGYAAVILRRMDRQGW